MRHSAELPECYSIYSERGFATHGVQHRSAAEPTKVAAVMYTFVDGMLEKRAPYRSEHLDLLKTMSKEGDCLIGEVPPSPNARRFARPQSRSGRT